MTHSSSKKIRKEKSIPSAVPFCSQIPHPRHSMHPMHMDKERNKCLCLSQQSPSNLRLMLPFWLLCRVASDYDTRLFMRLYSLLSLLNWQTYPFSLNVKSSDPSAVGPLWLLHTLVLQCRTLQTVIQDVVGLVRYSFVRSDQIQSIRSVFMYSPHCQIDVFFFP